LEKSKVYVLQKKPKQLAEDEEKLLAETDIQDVRKKLRTKKGMKELYKKYKTLEKAKKDYEQGNWRSVPEEYRFITFNTLMCASFGIQNEEWFVHYENGKISFGKPDGQVIFIGHLNAFNQGFFVNQLEVIDDLNLLKSEGEHKDIAQFFELFKLINTNQKYEIKRLLDIKQGKLEELNIHKGKILSNWNEWSRDTAPFASKEAMIQEKDGVKVYGTNAKLYNHSDATSVNLESIRLTYYAVLKSAEKDSTHFIALPCLEEQILNQKEDNFFKEALKTEVLVEEFLRAVRDLEEDYSKEKTFMTPRGKRSSKVVRATLYLEDWNNVKDGIQHVKDLLSGKKQEKVRNFEREKVVEKVETKSFVIEEVPDWKKNLEKKKNEKKKKNLKRKK